MNKNARSIIKAYAAITHNYNKVDILNKLNKSEVFNEIVNNNPIYLYESYPANLLEIVQELKELPSCPPEVYRVTESAVVQYNKAQRTKKKSVNTKSAVLADTDVIKSHSVLKSKPNVIQLGLYKGEGLSIPRGENVFRTGAFSALAKKRVLKKESLRKGKLLRRKKGTTI